MKPSLLFDFRLDGALGAVFVLGTLAACSDSDEITSYSIPKVVKTSEVPSWQAPASWQRVEASAMRLGSYAVTDDNGSALDVSVSALPGDSGGLAANVKRWLGQIGVEVNGEEALDAYVSEMKVDDLPARLVRAENKETGQALRVLTFTAKDKRWFFKVMGDAALAKREEANFKQFFGSVTFAHAHHGHDHAGHDHGHQHAAPNHNIPEVQDHNQTTGEVADHNHDAPENNGSSLTAAPEQNGTLAAPDHNHSHDE